jgi:hypothetical protein
MINQQTTELLAMIGLPPMTYGVGSAEGPAAQPPPQGICVTHNSKPYASSFFVTVDRDRERQGG